MFHIMHSYSHNTLSRCHLGLNKFIGQPLHLGRPYSTLLALLSPTFGKGPDDDDDKEPNIFAVPIYSQESHKWPLKKLAPLMQLAEFRYLL